MTFYNGVKVEKEAEAALPARWEKPDLLAFCRTPRSRREIAGYLGVGTVFYAMQHYVKPLLDAGKLAMTIPDKPRSRNQRYYTV